MYICTYIQYDANHVSWRNTTLCVWLFHGETEFTLFMSTHLKDGLTTMANHVDDITLCSKILTDARFHIHPNWQKGGFGFRVDKRGVG